MIESIDIYNVPNYSDVHLIEIVINESALNIDVGAFTQQHNNIYRMNWQTPWDEKYLNEDGSEIIGDWQNIPKSHTLFTRLIFFFHYLDFNKAFITPFGEIQLKQTIPMPNRLNHIVHYERPN